MNTQDLSWLSSTLLADVGALAMHSRLKPLVSGARLLGRALTVEVPHGDNLAIHAALSVAQPGDVIVVNGGGYLERALMGGIMMTQAKAAGLAGVVIDGAMRDTQELGSLGLAAFASGVHPAGPFKNGPGKVHTQIHCGGVVINDGDWIMGDDDGVVVIASVELNELVTAAHQKQQREKERLDAITRGELRPKRLTSSLASANVHILPRASTAQSPEALRS